jgi:DNA-binding transcriptional ArsR family regulator
MSTTYPAGVTAAPGPARRPATEQEVRALANPLRLRIIRETGDAPLTNAEIAARLGRDKATVLHHVRVLVEAGFLEPMPVRRGTRGSRERPYRSTGRSWRLDVAEAGHIGAVEPAMVEAFLAEVAIARRLEPPESTRLALLLSDAGKRELTGRLRAVLDEFAERPGDPGEAGTTPYAVFLSVYRRP